MNNLQAIIWDLDDTLLDTTKILIPIARTPAFEKRIREPLPLMPGALENLKDLSTRYRLFLLTYGRLEAQQAKIESLGIANFFEEIHIANPLLNESKTQYFSTLPAKWNLSANQVLSIGNRRSTDIGDAKLQGLATCLFHYGEHFDEPPRGPHDIPDFSVTGHAELVSKCRL